ncbi:MAG: dihydropteroate synthase [Ignavibacteria bacterium]
MKIRIRYFQNYNAYKRLNPENNSAQIFYFPTFGLTINFNKSEKNILKGLYTHCLERVCTFDLSWKKNFFCYFGDLNSFDVFSYWIKQESKKAFKEVQKLLSNFKLAEKFEYKIGNKIFSSAEKYVMGILNVTDDSFFDGGKYLDEKKIKERIDEFINAGVDIIDIGGESTRPGSEPISSKKELDRILPAVEYALSKNAIVSIDTYKSKVADKCLEIGAHIINDISGFKFDAKMADVCKKYNASTILMHIRGKPKTMQDNPYYEDTMAEIFDELKESIKIAEAKGIKNIFIDPGVGFGKRVFDNFEILNRLEELKFLGYPILIGLSRKSFIGKLLNLPPEDRLTGTIVANSIALIKGANIIRVHDHKEAIETKKLIQAITNPEITLQ